MQVTIIEKEAKEKEAKPEQSSKKNRVRPVRLRTSRASMEQRSDGSIIVHADEQLEPYPRVLTDRIFQWANDCPDRVCVAKRDLSGKWRRLTFSQLADRVRRVAQGLLNRDLSVERSVAILSENDIEHLILMLAGQHVGIPTTHISPSYSLISRDYSKLRYTVELISPGLVFVSDATKYRSAIQATIDENTELVITRNPPPGAKTTDIAELLRTTPTQQIEVAHERIDPDAIAKILFTSGSSGQPKAVINTHKMICSNQQMIRQTFRFLEDEPPVLLDWLPWNHTFGGNHNTGIALYNGGTLYIDDGKPDPGAIDETIRNLREISTTFYLNVPKAYADILPYLQSDAELRNRFFKRLRLLLYAGAHLSQSIWDAYRELALKTVGERVIMVTCLGATETAPMATQLCWDTDCSGNIGIPVPGVEAKLVPEGNKFELRVRGPSITPGYFRQPEYTAQAFDEEGYYRLRDAIRFAVPDDVNQGFFFDGRFSEDFKLASGTWVSAGPLRSSVLIHFYPFVRDVVITGHNRDELGMIIFADVDACGTLCGEPAGDNTWGISVLAQPAVLNRFRHLLEAFAKDATGASNRIKRAIIAREPPSLDRGEITDKGTLYPGRILETRVNLVEQLYASKPAHDSLLIRV